jgi:hypothetical protein
MAVIFLYMNNLNKNQFISENYKNISLLIKLSLDLLSFTNN